MSRERRILIDRGVYHTISRGHNKCQLFHSIEDYQIYRNLIREYQKRFPSELFHYCLMPNHIHMLLRILRGLDLPHLMQCINQAYARHYRKTYGLVGNLFQGRYKGLMIDSDEYLLECGRYIERNPLRTNAEEDLSRHHFSSFRFYTDGAEDDILTPNPLYEELSKDRAERMRLYREYVFQIRPYDKIIESRLK